MLLLKSFPYAALHRLNASGQLRPYPELAGRYPIFELAALAYSFFFFLLHFDKVQAPRLF